MKENIGLDLDGVICNTYPQAFQVLKEMYPDKITGNEWDSQWEEEFNLTQKEVRDCFIKCGRDGIFREAPVYEGAKRILHKIKKFYNIYIVTYRNYIPNSKEDTLYWLDSNKIPYNRMVMSKGKLGVAQKENFCFFLDDSISICNRIAKTKIPTYLFSRPWNKNKESDPLIKKVSSWKEIGDILLPYTRKR